MWLNGKVNVWSRDIQIDLIRGKVLTFSLRNKLTFEFSLKISNSILPIFEIC